MKPAIDKNKFYEILANLKLVMPSMEDEEVDQQPRALDQSHSSNYQPPETKRWSRFYSLFQTLDYCLDEPDGPWRKRYTLVPIQIALFFLAQG